MIRERLSQSAAFLFEVFFLNEGTELQIESS